MVRATDFYSEEDYYAALDERVATDDEAVAEFARNIGSEYPDRAWLLDDRDAWVRNPHYRGPAVPHPEADGDYDDEEFEGASVAAVMAFLDGEDLPF